MLFQCFVAQTGLGFAMVLFMPPETENHRLSCPAWPPVVEYSLVEAE